MVDTRLPRKVLKGRRGEYELEKSLEGRSQGLIDVVSRHLPEGPIVMANVPAKIRTDHFPTISLYYFESL